VVMHWARDNESQDNKGQAGSFIARLTQNERPLQDPTPCNVDASDSRRARMPSIGLARSGSPDPGGETGRQGAIRRLGN
jgi:hypothetical protein